MHRPMHFTLPLSRPLAIQVAFALLMAFGTYANAAPSGKVTNIDLTKGEIIPSGATHDWNLGATGARGWMYSERLTTVKARQVAITKIHKGSPADGILQPGDVLLGVGGKAFSHDPRTELGKALSRAESEAGQGNLVLTRWRAGKAYEVTVKLPVLGTYSPTAPFNCPKSQKILTQGCEALAKKMAGPDYRVRSPVPSTPLPFWQAGKGSTGRWPSKRRSGRPDSRRSPFPLGGTAMSSCSSRSTSS